MSIRERVKMPEPPELHGHVTIEFFDAETGVMNKRVEGDNFISVKANELLRRMMISALTAGVAKYSCGQPIANGYNGYWESPFFRYLVLTDYSGAEAPTTDTIIRGNLKGYCNYTPQSDANVLAGYANQEESWATPSQVHLVFDFATDKANGTFRSVYLATSYTPGIYSGEYKKTLKCKAVRNYSLPQYADGYFWGSAGNVIYKINMTTGEEVAAYDMLESFVWFCVSGGAIYYIPSFGTTVKQYAIASSVKTSLTIPYNCNRLATDGTYVYAHAGDINYSSNFWIVRIAASTFAVESSKTITPPDGYSYYGWSRLFIRGGVLHGLFYDNATTSDADTGWNRCTIDYGAGTITAYTVEYPTDRITIHDGTNDYVFLSNTGYMGSSGTQAANYAFYTTGLSTGDYNIFSRKLLASDQTKENDQVMKITYDIYIS